jgi:hypothetical protein
MAGEQTPPIPEGRKSMLWFLDIEASGLSPRSYPVEVAWGDTESGEVESHLINPDRVAFWLDWDPASESVHGLSRGYLRRNGEDPAEVAHRANAALSGVTVHATSGRDQDWMDTLFAAVGAKRHFVIGDVDDVLPASAERRYWAYREAWWQLGEQGYSPHRAGADVRHLIRMYHLLADDRAGGSPLGPGG